VAVNICYFKDYPKSSVFSLIVECELQNFKLFTIKMLSYFYPNSNF